MICKREGCPTQIKGPYFKAEVVNRDGSPAMEFWCETCAQKLEPNRYILRYKVEGKKLYMERYHKPNPEPELKGIGLANRVHAPIIQAPISSVLKKPDSTPKKAPESPPPPSPHSVGGQAGVNIAPKITPMPKLSPQGEESDLKPLWANDGPVKATVIKPMEEIEPDLKEVAPVVKESVKEKTKEPKSKKTNYFDDIST